MTENPDKAARGRRDERWRSAAGQTTAVLSDWRQSGLQWCRGSADRLTHALADAPVAGHKMNMRSMLAYKTVQFAKVTHAASEHEDCPFLALVCASRSCASRLSS